MAAAKRVMTLANYGKCWLTGLKIHLVKKLELGNLIVASKMIFVEV